MLHTLIAGESLHHFETFQWWFGRNTYRVFLFSFLSRGAVSVLRNRERAESGKSIRWHEYCQWRLFTEVPLLKSKHQSKMKKNDSRAEARSCWSMTSIKFSSTPPLFNKQTCKSSLQWTLRIWKTLLKKFCKVWLESISTQVVDNSVNKHGCSYF